MTNFLIIFNYKRKLFCQIQLISFQFLIAGLLSILQPKVVCNVIMIETLLTTFKRFEFVIKRLSIPEFINIQDRN